VQSEFVRFRAIALAILLAACSRPKPPTITPERAVVTAIGPSGIEMSLELSLHNPNTVDISARSVTATAVLDGKYTMSPVTIPRAFTLPARADAPLAVPMTLAWSDLSTLVTLAGTQRSIPYDVDGSVSLGGDLLHVDVPFHLSGVVTHEQLVAATLNSLPRSLPGLLPRAR
jgi:LEA14-like dessication related protein